MEIIPKGHFDLIVDRNCQHSLQPCVPVDFFNDLSMHYGQCEASINQSEEQRLIEQLIPWIIDFDKTLDHDSRFAGSMLLSGSVFEGTKVRIPDEYDYVKELSGLHSDDLILDHVTPDSVRSRMGTNQLHEKSFFRIRFKAEVPEEWRSCMSCKNCSETDHCQPHHQPQYLNPRMLQQEFARIIEDTLHSKTSDEVLQYYGQFSTINGPAISFYGRTVPIYNTGNYIAEKRKFPGILCFRQQRSRRRVTISLSAR